MNKSPYFGLWMLLAVALAAFIGLSLINPPVNVFGIDLQQVSFFQELTATVDAPSANGASPASVSHKPGKTATSSARHSAHQPVVSAPLDTTSKAILFIGDSMLDGLSPRLAAYAHHNGHKLYSVIWYSSTTEIWGRGNTLQRYINRYHPNYIFICLGANELFVHNVEQKRGKYIDKLLTQIGNIPYVWIGPPNWKKDTGINRLIASKVKHGSFFLSDGMNFERGKDGAHPTAHSASQWMDSVARWMKHSCAHPIKMNLPPKGTSTRATKVSVLQPVS